MNTQITTVTRHVRRMKTKQGVRPIAISRHHRHLSIRKRKYSGFADIFKSFKKKKDENMDDVAKKVEADVAKMQKVYDEQLAAIQGKLPKISEVTASERKRAKNDLVKELDSNVNILKEDLDKELDREVDRLSDKAAEQARINVAQSMPSDVKKGRKETEGQRVKKLIEGAKERALRADELRAIIQRQKKVASVREQTRKLMQDIDAMEAMQPSDALKFYKANDLGKRVDDLEKRSEELGLHDKRLFPIAPAKKGKPRITGTRAAAIVVPSKLEMPADMKENALKIYAKPAANRTEQEKNALKQFEERQAAVNKAMNVPGVLQRIKGSIILTVGQKQAQKRFAVTKKDYEARERVKALPAIPSGANMGIAKTSGGRYKISSYAPKEDMEPSKMTQRTLNLFNRLLEYKRGRQTDQFQKTLERNPGLLKTYGLKPRDAPDKVMANLGRIVAEVKNQTLTNPKVAPLNLQLRQARQRRQQLQELYGASKLAQARYKVAKQMEDKTRSQLIDYYKTVNPTWSLDRVKTEANKNMGMVVKMAKEEKDRLRRARKADKGWNTKYQKALAEEKSIERKIFSGPLPPVRPIQPGRPLPYPVDTSLMEKEEEK